MARYISLEMLRPVVEAILADNGETLEPYQLDIITRGVYSHLHQWLCDQVACNLYHLNKIIKRVEATERR